MEQLKEKGSLVSDRPRLGDQTLLVTSDCEDFPRGYRKGFSDRRHGHKCHMNYIFCTWPPTTGSTGTSGTSGVKQPFEGKAAIWARWGWGNIIPACIAGWRFYMIELDSKLPLP